MVGKRLPHSAPRHLTWRWPNVVTFAGVLIAATVAPGAAGATSLQADSGLPVAISGYTAALFASGSGPLSHPDAVVADSQHVFVAFQNDTQKDGTLTKNSSVVEYAADGSTMAAFQIPGHADGLRIDPSTGLLWATVNEDSNAVLYTINATTGEIKTYQFAAAPHGGGYEDLGFANGQAYIVASNPTLNSAGANVFPAVDLMTLQGSSVKLRPVLMGNAAATDTTTGSQVTLNEVDPDSMTFDPQGNLVLVDQGGAEVVFVNQPCSSQQSVTRIPVATQLDDTVWATTAKGRLFVVDGAKNAIYTLATTFAPGTVYTEMPSDSSITSQVGTLDLKTGFISPIAVGFGSPTGLLFVPEGAAPAAPAGATGCFGMPSGPQAPQIQLLNPNPGDSLSEGGYIFSGAAFDSAVAGPSVTGPGIDSVTAFLDDRDHGGTSLGSATLGQPTPAGVSSDFGATAGFTFNVTLPARKGNHALFIYAHSAISGLETVVQVPIKLL